MIHLLLTEWQAVRPFAARRHSPLVVALAPAKVRRHFRGIVSPTPRSPQRMC
jgi:hypothetical protein